MPFHSIEAGSQFLTPKSAKEHVTQKKGLGSRERGNVDVAPCSEKKKNRHVKRMRSVSQVKRRSERMTTAISD